MLRITPLAIALTIVAISSPITLHAQRGSGRGGATASGPRMDGGSRGARSSAPRRALPPRTTPAPPIPSLDHPLPYNFNAVRPAPLLGRGPIPAPFSVGPRFFNRQHPFTSIPYGYGYGYGYAAPDYGDLYATPPSPAQEDTGLLFLDVTPATAMVFADTAFVGSVDDLRSGLRLSPGHHWIDLEASGYDKKTLEINVAQGQPVRYQTELTPIRTASLAPPPPPHAPQTMYAIPGCYGGNTPPVAANLPKGCDIAKVRVLRPRQ